MGFESMGFAQQPERAEEKLETKRSEFEAVLATAKTEEDIPADFSERASDLLKEYLNGTYTAEDVQFYLDKKWLPE